MNNLHRISLIYRWHIFKAAQVIVLAALVAFVWFAGDAAIGAVVELKTRVVVAESAAHDALAALSGRVTLAEEPNSRYRYVAQMELLDMGEQR